MSEHFDWDAERGEVVMPDASSTYLVQDPKTSVWIACGCYPSDKTWIAQLTPDEKRFNAELGQRYRRIYPDGSTGELQTLSAGIRVPKTADPCARFLVKVNDVPWDEPNTCRWDLSRRSFWDLHSDMLFCIHQIESWRRIER